MDATCAIQASIHVFSLVRKYVSRILGTYQFVPLGCFSSYSGGHGVPRSGFCATVFPTFMSVTSSGCLPPLEPPLRHIIPPLFHSVNPKNQKSLLTSFCTSLGLYPAAFSLSFLVSPLSQVFHLLSLQVPL